MRRKTREPKPRFSKPPPPSASAISRPLPPPNPNLLLVDQDDLNDDGDVDDATAAAAPSISHYDAAPPPPPPPPAHPPPPPAHDDDDGSRSNLHAAFATSRGSGAKNACPHHLPDPDCIMDDVDWMEEEERGLTCISCNRAGHGLLVCTQPACPIALHPPCLRFQPDFDPSSGSFCCPFCWLKHQLTLVTQFRNKAMLAKKVLLLFMHSNAPTPTIRTNLNDARAAKWKGVHSNLTSTVGNRNHCSPMDIDGGDRGQVQKLALQAGRDHQNDRNATKLYGRPQSGAALEHEVNPSPPISDADANDCNSEGKNTPSFKSFKDSSSIENNLNEGNSSATHDEFSSLGNEGYMQGFQDGRHTGNAQDTGTLSDEKQSQSPNTHCVQEETRLDAALHRWAKVISTTMKEPKEDQVRSKKTSQGQNQCNSLQTMTSASKGAASPQVTEMSDSNTEQVHYARVKSTSKRDDAQPQNTELPFDSRKDAGEKSKKVNPSKRLGQPQEPAKELTGIKFAKERRQRLNWTLEEVEMLKEGVQKFGSTMKKKFPWWKILDYGRHVFHSTRTPTDLKDKWRNLVAKESLC